jgi:hypothetical protein
VKERKSRGEKKNPHPENRRVRHPHRAEDAERARSSRAHDEGKLSELRREGV